MLGKAYQRPISSGLVNVCERWQFIASANVRWLRVEKGTDVDQHWRKAVEGTLYLRDVAEREGVAFLKLRKSSSAQTQCYQVCIVIVYAVGAVQVCACAYLTQLEEYHLRGPNLGQLLKFDMPLSTRKLRM